MSFLNLHEQHILFFFLKRNMVLLWKLFFDVYIDSLEVASNFCTSSVLLWKSNRRVGTVSFLVGVLSDFLGIGEIIRGLYCSIFVHGKSLTQWWKYPIKFFINCNYLWKGKIIYKYRVSQNSCRNFGSPYINTSPQNLVHRKHSQILPSVH